MAAPKRKPFSDPKAAYPKLYLHVEPQWPVVSPCPLGLIGEAPSDMERIWNKPLVGPAGHILDQILRTANIDRNRLFITNLFDEKLPDNDIINWSMTPEEYRQFVKEHGEPPPPFNIKVGKGYLRPEHYSFVDRLRRELDRAKPTVLVPLGGTALWAFAGTDAITVSRGALCPASFIMPGHTMLPTFHPEFVRHQWPMFHFVVGDLKKAMNTAEKGGVIKYTKREIWIEPTLADLRYFKKEYIDPAAMLSLDIETGGGQITCVGVGVSVNLAIVVPFVDYRKPNRSYWGTTEEEVAAIEWIEEVCAMKQPKVLQNGLYDLYWLMEDWSVHVMNYLHDTRLAHHALYPELPKDLGSMGASYGQETAWKRMREHKGEKRDE